jgi:hypothetical protein
MEKILIMAKHKRLVECFDQWNDQTCALAEYIDSDDFQSLADDCKSYSDFQCQAKDKVTGIVDTLKQQAAECNIESPMLNMLLIMSLNGIEIDKIVKAICNCYESNLRLVKISDRVNKLYEQFVKTKEHELVVERSTTSAHDGQVAAMDIAIQFDKDDLDIDSIVDVKNKKDAWILRLVYNDGNKENLSLVKASDDKRDYTIKSDKDKLNVSFSDKDSGDSTLSVPQTVIDHIAKHIEQAEKNAEDDKKNNDSDLAKEIAYDIKKEFHNYDMEVIEGDIGNKKWTIEIVYKNGDKDHFTINKVGKSYIMKSKDFFIAKFTLDELKNFPQKLKAHIEKHVNKSEKK